MWPVFDTSLFHVSRLYEILRERAPVVANSPAEFRGLAHLFGETLNLYHNLYVLRPYEKLRTMDISGLPPYARTLVRDELAVQREDYNDFIRVSNWFGTRVNDTFGENLFPVYLEIVTPV